ncbi:hypothetical protein A9Q83_12835 [Alphaproteobacteria bacterium 46_93_T64]|nr:hypothetical protein A9Q83_12835 [Alphaproteobacteria bacterium 46_93_T64]
MEIFKLETERLAMRPMIASDTNTLFRLYGDPEVMASRKIGTLDRAKSDTELASILDHWRRRNFGLFAIIEKASGQFIGECGLREIKPDTDDIEISYGLYPSNWGYGYATEAASKMIEFGFATLALPKIYGIANSKNASSLKILQRFGMTYESDFTDGTSRIVRSSLTRDVYLNLQETR